MGSVVITEHAASGTVDDPNTPIAGNVVATTVNATSTTTGTAVTANGATRMLRVHSVSGAHRVRVNTSTITDADTIYEYIPDGKTIDIPIAGGKSYVYRSDA